MAQWHGDYPDIREKSEELVLEAAEKASQKWGIDFSLQNIDIVEEVETEYWGASETFYHVECKFLGRAFAKTVFFSVNFMVNEDPDTGRDWDAEYELEYPELSEEDVYDAYTEALEAGEWQGEDGKMTPRSLFAWAEEHGLADKEICYEITADYKGGYGRSHMGFPYFSERDDVIVFMTNGE